MKVLIFPGYGAGCFTPKLKEIIERNGLKGDSFRYNPDIIEYIEKNSIFWARNDLNDSQDLVKYLKANQEAILRLVDTVDEKPVYTYFIFNPNIQWATALKIVDVDTSRIWGINEYDGCESIKYLEPECINKDINYYRF